MSKSAHRKRIVLIGGLPASGKTTLALGLKDRLEASTVLIDGDAVWHQMLGTTPQLPDMEPSNFNRRNIFRRLAGMVGKTVVSAIGTRTIILAHSFEAPRERRVFEYLPALLGADLYAFWLIAPLAVAGERAFERQSLHLAGKRDPNNYSLGNPSKYDPYDFATSVGPKWVRIDASAPRAHVLAQTLQSLGSLGCLLKTSNARVMAKAKLNSAHNL